MKQKENLTGPKVHLQCPGGYIRLSEWFPSKESTGSLGSQQESSRQKFKDLKRIYREFDKTSKL